MFINLFIPWLVFLPFIVWKGYFEAPKVSYFYFGILFIIIFWVFKLVRHLENLRLSKTDLWYFGWLTFLLVSSIFGVHPLDSILGGSYRHQGVLFFLGLWLVGKTIGILSDLQKKHLIKYIAISILVEAGIFFLQKLGGNLYFGNPLGTLGETNAVAGFLAIGSFFVFIVFPKVLFLIPAIAVFLTESRSGIISLFIVVGVYINSLGKKPRVLFIPAIFIVVALVVAFISRNKLSSIFENRPTIWRLGIESVIKRPFLGYGAESGEFVYNLSFQKEKIPLNGLIIDRAHNLFLDVAMWSGIIGLAFFLGWLIESFKAISFERKFAFASFIIYSSFQPLSVVHWVLFIIVLTS